MTMMEAVKVVPALREAAVLEPLTTVVLYEPATITVLETATSWSRATKVAACIRSGTAIGAAGEVAATAHHCAGMASTTAPPTATTAGDATAEGSMASAATTPAAAVATPATATVAAASTSAASAATMDERNGAAMDAGAHSIPKIRHACRLSWPQYPRC
jgi:hypothetical protein